MESPSFRTYLHAFELKQAGLDWRRGVLSRCLIGPALEVARLKADPNFTSEAARVRAFVQSGSGCRATYFRHAKRLQPAVAPPRLQLTQRQPPAEAQLDADHLDRLRQRFGELGHG